MKIMRRVSTQKRYPVRRTSSILQKRDIVKTFFKKEERIDGIMSRNLGAYLIPEAQLHKNSDYFVRQKPHGDFSAVFCRLIRGRLWRETTHAAGDTIPRIIQNICFCVFAWRETAPIIEYQVVILLGGYLNEKQTARLARCRFYRRVYGI